MHAKSGESLCAQPTGAGPVSPGEGGLPLSLRGGALSIGTRESATTAASDSEASDWTRPPHATSDNEAKSQEARMRPSLARIRRERYRGAPASSSISPRAAIIAMRRTASRNILPKNTRAIGNTTRIASDGSKCTV